MDLRFSAEMPSGDSPLTGEKIMHRLTQGQKPPAKSSVTLYRTNLGGDPTAVEWFESDENPDWICPDTVNGFWYAYETHAEIEAWLRSW
jgi:hypothetical protein